MQLAECILDHIRQTELLHAGDRLGVAVSGGIDSVALLRVLLELRQELGIVLSVVHFNHKLRGVESDADEQFVAELAHQHGLEFHAEGFDVAAQAAEQHVSIETAARDLRYWFFRHLLGEDSPDVKLPSADTLDKIATGHTLDDQAETVLMRLIRGTGLRGLGGIHPRILVEDSDGEATGEIIRPMLGIRHRELEQYLKGLKQPWREDSSNADQKFTRNRVRQLLVPLLEREFNPAVAENLAELSEIARAEEDFWENEVSGWVGTTVRWSAPQWLTDFRAALEKSQSLVRIQSAASLKDSELLQRINDSTSLIMNGTVSRAWLVTEPLAVQRRLVKSIGEYAGIPLEFKHVEEILRFAAEEDSAGKELSLPLNWKAVCEPEALVFVTPDLREQESVPQDYEYDFTWPGRLEIPETRTVIEAICLSSKSKWESEPEAKGYNPLHLLDADSLPKQLQLRNWRPGDRFWPAHTKSSKKIKELLNERHVPPPDRRLWPVIQAGDEIVWVRGFPAAARFRPKAGSPAVAIREVSLDDE